ncbi:uncharacterized protein LOC129286505 [Prosopis cineraria]|uniref:uncharacterized protein LOC129286505 n=1 Tax=Prosopis cineraria TaxID=364024 RepID=UPI00240EDE56|nr:uncharacterized protein LOC129286505 [Prosopis cineraria]
MSEDSSPQLEFVFRSGLREKTEGKGMTRNEGFTFKQWRPNFNLWKVDTQWKIAVWVHILYLLFELYNVESLRRIGNMVGRTLKVDLSTSIYDKGVFDRICAEIDLHKPLLLGFAVFGKVWKFEYEGLHQVCFHYGKYGHLNKDCPLINTDSEQGEVTSKVNEENGDEKRRSTAIKKTSSDKEFKRLVNDIDVTDLGHVGPALRDGEG